MVEPGIQYAKTEDGVSIAYYALGHGPAIVRMPSIPWSHFQLQWQTFPEQRAAAEVTAQRFTFVEYDSRGTGSSAREVTDFALDAHMLDLEAVVNKLGLDHFALIGQINSSPVAISYAVRNPQRCRTSQPGQRMGCRFPDIVPASPHEVDESGSIFLLPYPPERPGCPRANTADRVVQKRGDGGSM